MIDSGATGNFFDTNVASKRGLLTRRKREAYGLSVIDGEQIGTNKGLVTHETEMLDMETEGYSEKIRFDLVAIGTHTVILGMPWLRLHNPQIDWQKERITMSQCRCGSDHKTPHGDKRSPGLKEVCATIQSPEDLA